jgi:alpha-L-fucosidase
MPTWFDGARFGMFVHWGHSSQQGVELSWPLVGGISILPACTSVAVDAYHATAATFDPRAWDPRDVARRAKRAGMQYVVFTTKHHDGFAMWPTRTSEFSIARTPHGRDVVGPLVAAVRAEGLRVGLYFSLIDWHHPDYPAFTEADKPYVLGAHRRPDAVAWRRFTDVMLAQVRELLTDYAPVDCLWFDGGWERTPEEWRATELEAMIRTLAPGILINDRLPGVAGDYDTPEQFVPAEPPGRPWETAMTINESWGWNRTDRAFKSTRRLVHTLCEVAGRGGNLLLDVAPMGDGRLQPELVERLDGVTRWMARHAEAILGTTPGLAPWQFYGPSTRRGDRVYLHCLMQPYDAITVRGVPVRRVRRIVELGSGTELAHRARTTLVDQLFNADPVGELTIDVPERLVDPDATVVAIDFAPTT